MNDAQQVFGIFYAIFFGIMLQMVALRSPIKIKDKKIAELMNGRDFNASLNLFDTPNAWAIGFDWNNKPFIRAFFSIAILNILPAVIFASFYIGLNQWKSPLTLEQMTILVWISLTSQHVYRVFYALITIPEFLDFLYLSKGKNSKIDKYADHDQMARQLLDDQRLRFEAHKESFFHIAFPIFMYAPSVILLYDHYLVSNQLPQFLICFSYCLLFGGLTSLIVIRILRK